MYMRNNKRPNQSYYINDLPPNYSGQYAKESLPPPIIDVELEANADTSPIPEPPPPPESSGFLGTLGNILKPKNGGGMLSGILSGKKIKNIFSDLDFEDLILLGVMFFLLRDGAEDELLLILAIILFTGG